MSKGKFFGEIALLKNVPRTANVTAQDTVKVYSLDRASFGARLLCASAVRICASFSPPEAHVGRTAGIRKRARSPRAVL